MPLRLQDTRTFAYPSGGRAGSRFLFDCDSAGWVRFGGKSKSVCAPLPAHANRGLANSSPAQRHPPQRVSVSQSSCSWESVSVPSPCYPPSCTESSASKSTNGSERASTCTRAPCIECLSVKSPSSQPRCMITLAGGTSD